MAEFEIYFNTLKEELKFREENNVKYRGLMEAIDSKNAVVTNGVISKFFNFKKPIKTKKGIEQPGIYFIIITNSMMTTSELKKQKISQVMKAITENYEIIIISQSPSSIKLSNARIENIKLWRWCRWQHKYLRNLTFEIHTDFANKKNIQKIKINDPISLFLKVEKGDVICVIRNENRNYRLVV